MLCMPVSNEQCGTSVLQQTRSSEAPPKRNARSRLRSDWTQYRSCYWSINNPMSTDSNLQDLISSMQRDEQAIVLTGLDSCVQYSLTCTTIRIAESLLRNEASLLSDAYQELMITLEQALQKSLPCGTVNPTSLVPFSPVPSSQPPGTHGMHYKRVICGYSPAPKRRRWHERTLPFTPTKP